MTMETSNAEGSHPPTQQDECAHSSRRNGAFRFKSSKSTSSRNSKDRPDNDPYRSSRPHKRHHSPHESRTSRSSKRRHKHKKRAKESDRDRNDEPPPNTTEPPLSPSTAFRESLFDALGDDEGAAYWESVYGQPIHTYSIPSIPKGPEGELEQMTDEEYAAYVRARMWERTREGMEEEQERLRAEKRRAKMNEDTRTRREDERRAFDDAMEESLRRGAERKRRRAWEGVWMRYLERWEEVAKIKDEGGGGMDKCLRNLLFWPVQSGKRRDVTSDSVREFMEHAPPQTDLVSTLKAERVRWHPDKIQHRYGGLGIDDVVMRSVTEVFQIIDRMWNEERERSGKT